MRDALQVGAGARLGHRDRADQLAASPSAAASAASAPRCRSRGCTGATISCTALPKPEKPCPPVSSYTTHSWPKSPPRPPCSSGMSQPQQPGVAGLGPHLAVDMALLDEPLLVRQQLAWPRSRAPWRGTARARRWPREIGTASAWPRGYAHADASGRRRHRRPRRPAWRSRAATPTSSPSGSARRCTSSRQARCAQRGALHGGLVGSVARGAVPAAAGAEGPEHHRDLAAAGGRGRRLRRLRAPRARDRAARRHPARADLAERLEAAGAHRRRGRPRRPDHRRPRRRAGRDPRRRRCRPTRRARADPDPPRPHGATRPRAISSRTRCRSASPRRSTSRACRWPTCSRSTRATSSRTSTSPACTSTRRGTRPRSRFWEAIATATVETIAQLRDAWHGWLPREIDLGGGFPSSLDGVGGQIERVAAGPRRAPRRRVRDGHHGGAPHRRRGARPAAGRRHRSRSSRAAPSSPTRASTSRA